VASRRQDLSAALHPAYVIWELTLRCDQACAHCGSRAGAAREDELGLEEALRVVRELAELGCKEVTLMGGEAYLHPGFLEIVAALKAAGIRPTMTTGGRAITPELARRIAGAGLHSVSVSVDGLEPTHELVRGVKGSFRSATGALRALRGAGLPVAANTNVSRVNLGELEALYEVLRGLGIRGWQLQITAAEGRAADRPAMLLQPWDLLELVPRVIALKERAFRDGITLMPGNNLGYFGAGETALRSLTPDGTDHWHGCQAGRFILGIESGGGVKGCASLASRHYVGGNLREAPLPELWAREGALAFTRSRTVEDLWGFCRTCPFGPTCLGGCTFTAHALFGRAGNNPYCHYRAHALKKQGKRERLVPVAAAPGQPFDHGRFELVEEPFRAPEEPALPQRELLRKWCPLT